MKLMNKKLQVAVLLSLISTFSFSFTANDMAGIKSFKIFIEEKSKINGRTKKKKYNTKAILPNKILKEMTYPSLNKGEKYLYSNGKKKIHIPKLNMTRVEKTTSEENYVLKVINDIKNIPSNKGRYSLLKSGNEIKGIKYNDGTTIRFISDKNIGGRKFPNVIHVYQGGSKVSDLRLNSIQINPRISSSEFNF